MIPDLSTLRTRFPPDSAMYTLPCRSTATPAGSSTEALAARTLSSTARRWPLPANVTMIPALSILRTRLLSLSAIKIFPTASTAIPCGLSSFASIAGPPSPTPSPPPATVSMRYSCADAGDAIKTAQARIRSTFRASRRATPLCRSSPTRSIDVISRVSSSHPRRDSPAEPQSIMPDLSVLAPRPAPRLGKPPGTPVPILPSCGRGGMRAPSRIAPTRCASTPT